MGMKDVEILIVPDVHGRDFWREPVMDALEKSDACIIFLGDYLDPYIDEWKEYDLNPREHAIDILKEILEIKSKFPQRVTLLIGNHDSGYIFYKDLCNSRMDHLHYDNISNLFNENYDLFQVAEMNIVNEKKFVFSHAGISQEYARVAMDLDKDDVLPEIDEAVKYLNEKFATRNLYFIKTLGLYSNYRGYSFCSYGSVIWSDFREWVSNPPTSTPFDNVVNIMGHTQLASYPLNLGNLIYDLDVRQCFYIDSEGVVKFWDSSKTISEVEE